MQGFESGSLENDVVQRELYQLFTWAAGNGVRYKDYITQTQMFLTDVILVSYL